MDRRLKADKTRVAREQTTNPHGLRFIRDEYFRDVLHGLKPGGSISIPTPWGMWSLKMEADGKLEVYMASHGAAQCIHVAPKVTNIVEIIPVVAR